MSGSTIPLRFTGLPSIVPQGSSSAEACGPQLSPVTLSAVQPAAKTSIAELMELTMKMGLVCNFETVANTGPSHKRLFVMHCTVGDITAEGSGCGKKKAKHEAARMALNKLKESQLYVEYVNQWTTTSGLAPHNNPISHLQEVVVKNGMQKPEFEVSNGDGPPHQRTFETTVTVGNLLCTGKGRSKKESKRKAAEAMLNTINKTNLSLEPPRKRMAFVPARSAPLAPISFLPAGTL
ncbi:Interferon-inducible double-stranded RNA-dependent protein kinase activator A [Stylophora pistillata]|uniref:Interferon-inducible double-stranded RNA-dependent protein kinase activator A n=2 Tax=Stylophora pistillata TaxID=50429 RepID=A0A2B4S6J2_STYPI|nr:Interferon-inducible double-stranded RNA-dependent protein kinase activator A [Stylophora pistillata]